MVGRFAVELLPSSPTVIGRARLRCFRLRGGIRPSCAPHGYAEVQTRSRAMSRSNIETWLENDATPPTRLRAGPGSALMRITVQTQESRCSTAPFSGSATAVVAGQNLREYRIRVQIAFRIGRGRSLDRVQRTVTRRVMVSSRSPTYCGLSAMSRCLGRPSMGRVRSSTFMAALSFSR
jgi:hypothetical protein